MNTKSLQHGVHWHFERTRVNVALTFHQTVNGLLQPGLLITVSLTHLARSTMIWPTHSPHVYKESRQILVFHSYSSLACSHLPALNELRHLILRQFYFTRHLYQHRCLGDTSTHHLSAAPNDIVYDKLYMKAMSVFFACLRGSRAVTRLQHDTTPHSQTRRHVDTCIRTV